MQKTDGSSGKDGGKFDRGFKPDENQQASSGISGGSGEAGRWRDGYDTFLKPGDVGYDADRDPNHGINPSKK